MNLSFFCILMIAASRAVNGKSMKRKNETMVRLYQLLGRVFYAAAQADSVIRAEEISALKQIVKEVWLDVDETFDDFQSDSAHQIEIVFDYLLEDEIQVEDALEQLKEFKKIHSSLFTVEVSNLIMETAHRIISAFAKRNKSELIFMSQLQLIIEKS
jgi:hypothetical protein